MQLHGPHTLSWSLPNCLLFVEPPLLLSNSVEGIHGSALELP